MCRTERERETRRSGRGAKGEGVFSIAPVERREWKGRERKKKREKRRQTEVREGYILGQAS